MQILSRDFFFFNYTATTEIYTYGHTLSLHDALPISTSSTMTASAMRRYSGFTRWAKRAPICAPVTLPSNSSPASTIRSEEHTSELQSLMRISYAVFCLKKKTRIQYTSYQPTNQMTTT